MRNIRATCTKNPPKRADLFRGSTQSGKLRSGHWVLAFINSYSPRNKVAMSVCSVTPYVLPLRLATASLVPLL